jgi:hypothetical protein
VNKSAEKYDLSEEFSGDKFSEQKFFKKKNFIRGECSGEEFSGKNSIIEFILCEEWSGDECSAQAKLNSE